MTEKQISFLLLSVTLVIAAIDAHFKGGVGEFFGSWASNFLWCAALSKIIAVVSTFRNDKPTRRLSVQLGTAVLLIVLLIVSRIGLYGHPNPKAVGEKSVRELSQMKTTSQRPQDHDSQSGLLTNLEAVDARERFRSTLTKIDLSAATDPDDYINRCEKVRPLIPSMQDYYAEARRNVIDAVRRHPADKSLLRVADFVLAINQKDEAGVDLLNQEMHMAEQMKTVPKKQRRDFFAQKIGPLQMQEVRIAKEEIELARKAKADGLPLPDYIEGAL